MHAGQGLIFTDGFRNGRVLFQIIGKLFADNAVHSTSRFGISQLLLGLSLKLGILNLHTDNGSQAFPDILTGKIRFIVPEQLIVSCIIIKGLGNGIPEAHQMGAAFRCIYIVDKAVNAFRVGIVMLHCHFHINIILLPSKYMTFS